MGRLPFLAFAEDVGVGARAVERDNAYLGVLLVEQQPIGTDVALPIAIVVATEHVVVKIDGQGLVLAQHINHRQQFLYVQTAPYGHFYITVVLLVGLNLVELLHSAIIAFLNSSNDS